MPASPVPNAAVDATPPAFLAAVAAIRGWRPRAEILFDELPAPQRLAPWAHAVSATVLAAPDSEDEIGTGRLVLLHDPDGVAAWAGRSRYVMFASCEVEGEIARDPLLPDVAWSWLLDALAHADAGYIALSGTVTATSSVRFGEIAGDADELTGPGDEGARRSDDVEIRASWTAVDDGGAAEPHIAAFTGLLTIAAGLPPEGVAPIGAGRQPPRR